MKYKNIQMEMMLEMIKPVLPHRDKIGYVSARNTRKLIDTLTEYFQFKDDLIKKYGEIDKGTNDEQPQTMSIHPSSPNFKAFAEEFDKIKDIEHEVELMKLKYSEVIGLLNGEEILKLEFMLEE